MHHQQRTHFWAVPSLEVILFVDIHRGFIQEFLLEGGGGGGTLCDIYTLDLPPEWSSAILPPEIQYVINYIVTCNNIIMNTVYVKQYLTILQTRPNFII